jgi:hypothetical protein
VKHLGSHYSGYEGGTRECRQVLVVLLSQVWQGSGQAKWACVWGPNDLPLAQPQRSSGRPYGGFFLLFLIGGRLDSIKEFWNSLTERFRSPIGISLLMSWMVVNYKLVVVLLSEESYRDKFLYIDTVIYGPNTNPIVRLLILPLAGACFYTLIFPIFSLFFTWVSSNYERLHNDVKKYALKKSLLTVEERDQLLEETEEIVNKAQRDAEDAKKIRIGSIKATRENSVRIFSKVLDPIMRGLEQEVGDWSQPVVMPPEGRNVSGPEICNVFIKKHGIPEHWASLFGIMSRDALHNVTVAEVSKKMQLSEDESIDMLIRLCSLRMLHLNWTADEPCFALQEGPWVALLNGRGA